MKINLHCLEYEVVILLYLNSDLIKGDIKLNDTLKIIEQRRSIRAFKKKNITNLEKEQIIHSALRSPTAGNMMLYSIIEVEDQAIKKKLVISCDNQSFIARAPFVLLFLADYQRWMDYFDYSEVDEYINREKLVKKTPEEGDLMLAACDALIAAQTAVIAAESMGIGSCYIGDIMENYEFHRDLFALPKYTFPITLICFGYPADKALQREYTTRLDVNYVLFKNKYQGVGKDGMSKMYSDRELNRYAANANNFGQHMYHRKFSSDFSLEMTRSVKAAIKEWCS